MKRTVLYTLLIALLSLATSCDKIEQNEYIIPSGITGEWLVSLKDIPTKQCAMATSVSESTVNTSELDSQILECESEISMLQSQIDVYVALGTPIPTPTPVPGTTDAFPASFSPLLPSSLMLLIFILSPHKLNLR